MGLNAERAATRRWHPRSYIQTSYDLVRRIERDHFDAGHVTLQPSSLKHAPRRYDEGLRFVTASWPTSTVCRVPDYLAGPGAISGGEVEMSDRSVSELELLLPGRAPVRNGRDAAGQLPKRLCTPRTPCTAARKLYARGGCSMTTCTGHADAVQSTAVLSVK